MIAVSILGIKEDKLNNYKKIDNTSCDYIHLDVMDGIFVENKVDFTKSRNLVIAAVILVCGLGFSSGLTFTIAGTSITLTGLALAAIAGIILNAILPGNDYEFNADVNIKKTTK